MTDVDVLCCFGRNKTYLVAELHNLAELRCLVVVVVVGGGGGGNSSFTPLIAELI